MIPLGQQDLQCRFIVTKTTFLLFLAVLFIRWILDSYLRQYVCVMWDSCKSEYFKMYNGIKQSGVISCHLFNLYIDPLLIQLSNSGYGCHIAGVYAGALS